MNEDTRSLLEECSAGCKMATQSMKQILEYVEDEEQERLIQRYIIRHQELERESAKRLNQAGTEEKEPGSIASAFSFLTTEMKMMMKDDRHQIAKIMMDGCNMGVQSIGKYLNQYAGAEREVKELAQKLMNMETEFFEELKPFL